MEVGRPGEPTDLPVEIGQPLRFPALERESIDLRLLVAPVRDERDRFSVGAPGRASVLVLAEREAQGLAARERDEPEMRLVSVLLRIDGPDLIDHAASIR